MAMIAGALGGSLISGIFGSKAAGTQASAAKYAANLQAQSAKDSLDFQKQEFNTTQQNEAPFIKAGQGAVTTLSDLMKGGGFPNWTDTFQAPTGATEQNDPGYQFRLQQGKKALEDSAAARGGVLSTGTAEDLTKFGQDYASNEYGNVYSRAQQQYEQAHNIFRENQTDTFNRYASLAGLGQTSTGTAGQLGQEAATNTGNINLTSGAQQGAALQNSAYQTASGYVNTGNAISGGLQLSLAQLMKQFGGTNGLGSGPGPLDPETGLPTVIPGV